MCPEYGIALYKKDNLIPWYSVLKALFNVLFLDCNKSATVGVDMSCSGGILEIVWPTDTTFPGNTTNIPESLQAALNEQIKTRGAYFTIFIMNKMLSVCFGRVRI